MNEPAEPSELRGDVILRKEAIEALRNATAKGEQFGIQGLVNQGFNSGLGRAIEELESLAPSVPEPPNQTLDLQLPGRVRCADCGGSNLIVESGATMTIREPLSSAPTGLTKLSEIRDEIAASLHNHREGIKHCVGGDDCLSCAADRGGIRALEYISAILESSSAPTPETEK
jgi:hypothetical protein